jgi:hypothetical protein
MLDVYNGAIGKFGSAAPSMDEEIGNMEANTNSQETRGQDRGFIPTWVQSRIGRGIRYTRRIRESIKWHEELLITLILMVVALKFIPTAVVLGIILVYVAYRIKGK